MPRRFERLQSHLPEIDDVAVAERCERELGLRCRTQVDRRADAVAQLEVTGNEVRMEVGQEHVFDSQTVFRGERQVLLDVTLWIENRGGVRLLVTDQIRGVRQAIQIKLLENHRPTFIDVSPAVYTSVRNP